MYKTRKNELRFCNSMLLGLPMLFFLTNRRVSVRELTDTQRQDLGTMSGLVKH